MATVGCAGILAADTVCGPMRRLPLAGELLAIDRMPSSAGGCAANVAIDLAKQGIAVDVCGCVGGDPSAEVLLESLGGAGVGCGQLQRLATHATSQTMILLVEGEDRRFIHMFGANAGFEVRHIRRDWIDGLKVLYFGGFFATPAVRSDELAELFRYCRSRGIATVLDVIVPQAGRGMESLEPLLPHVDYFLPNDDEAERLTELTTPEAQAARFLQCGAGTVMITCGGGGALAARGGRRWRAAAYPVQAVDPSGSGDAFAAGVIAGIVHGWEMADTLRYAAALGASATTAIGTTAGVLDAREAAAFVRQHPLEVAVSEQGN